MSNPVSGIDEILGRWRQEIKAKQRRIISFEETAEIKIKSLKPWIYPETAPLGGWECREFTYGRKRDRRYHTDWAPIAVGGAWGGPDRSAEFRCTARMPAAFAGKNVVLKLYFSGDGLLSVNGKPYHGLDPFRDTVPLTACAAGDEVYALSAESYIFWHFGESEIKTFECSHFAVLDPEMWEIYWDFRAAYNVLVMNGLEPGLAAFIEAGFQKAIWLIDQNETDPARVRASARAARDVLRREIYQSDRFQKEGLLHLCGNSHLDVVFLWTHAEFVRKLARTHASTLRLMEQYPDYVFSQSQPLMYEEMKANYPAMYEEVKQRVREGRWEVIGASWVEPDCNLISGESFVRQFLHGILFIEKEFGITPKTCWCPDVFGNTWTMPQILARCGLKYFVTHKMVVWNDTNPWTKHTFWWQGPDGSRILSLVPPTHFIGTVEPDHMTAHWNAFSDKQTIGESLYNYGWGDGGGGPDPEMLEYMKRYQAFPGITPAKPITIEGALASIEAKAGRAGLPVVNDELYLEEHRGVHTTKARLKKLNRYCEMLYRKAEMWSVFAGVEYPRERLDAGWKHVLTNQFHDSLPGSHIPPVYLDLQDAYAEATATGEAVLAEALRALAGKFNTAGNGAPHVLFNALPQARTDLVMLPGTGRPGHVVDAQGVEVPSQLIEDFTTGEPRRVFEATLPPAGAAVYYVREGRGAVAAAPLAAGVNVLENQFLRAEFDGNGELTRLLNKQTGCEIFAPRRRGNVLKLYEDVPGKYEAWDIAPTYTQVEFPLPDAEVRLVARGPVCAALEVTRRFGASRWRQRILLGASARCLVFQTWVDWHEQQKLLKVRFHTPFVTRTATYDIAYGNIERSAYRNNSFDAAKFEVPAHQWMDLSQPDNGLSLLNDCKYGHEAFDGMMALTLLRGPRNPDPRSDQEEHRFTYALYPHAGVWREAGTIQQAACLNDPVDVIAEPRHDGALRTGHRFLQVDNPAVTLEAVKRAERSDEIIVRLVERHGAGSKARLRFAQPVTNVRRCNLLEREDEAVETSGDAIPLELKPYEIRTLKIAAFRGT
jgi:alpha-mannosidase